jgi:hypothetical protein
VRIKNDRRSSDRDALVTAAAAAGIAVLAVSAVARHALSVVSWFSPSIDVAVFILATVAAAIGFTDAWTERDRRPLPLASATLTVGLLWLANVPTYASTQTRVGLGLLAHTVGPVLWVLSWAWTRPVFLRHPSRSILSSAAGAVLSASALVVGALLLLPHLPVLAHGTRATELTRFLAVAAVVPLAWSAWLFRRSGPVDHSGDGSVVGLQPSGPDAAAIESAPFVAGMVLLCFQGAAAGIPHDRFSIAG